MDLSSLRIARRLTLALVGAFLFAPLFHPAMRHVGPIRRELGVGTIMNMYQAVAPRLLATLKVLAMSCWFSVTPA